MADAAPMLAKFLFNFPPRENSLYVISLGLPSVKEEPIVIWYLSAKLLKQHLEK